MVDCAPAADALQYQTQRQIVGWLAWLRHGCAPAEMPDIATEDRVDVVIWHGIDRPVLFFRRVRGCSFACGAPRFLLDIDLGRAVRISGAGESCGRSPDRERNLVLTLFITV